MLKALLVFLISVTIVYCHIYVSLVRIHFQLYLKMHNPIQKAIRWYMMLHGEVYLVAQSAQDIDIYVAYISFTTTGELIIFDTSISTFHT